MLALPCLGQEPPAPQPKPALRNVVREVALPVTVRDKKGSPVTTLKASDFTLTEDGRPQTIKSLTHENLPFRLGLLVGTNRGLLGAMESERKAAGKFVDEMLPANSKAGPDTEKDQAFLIHYDREVELMEDFTSSRDKLHHELEEIGSSGTREDALGPEVTGDDRERPRNGRGGTQLYDAIYLAADELMKTQEGRKSLVVFSDGVDRGSKESLNDAVDAAERANVAVFTIYFKGEQERDKSGTPGLGGGRRGGMGGGGYPGGGGGYPGGGGRGGSSGGNEPKVDGKKILEKIAERTGGRSFEAKKKDNLEEIYGQIAGELRGQYLLTYIPDMADKEGGFHKIALKTSNSDLTVTVQEGYFAPEGK